MIWRKLIISTRLAHHQLAAGLLGSFADLGWLIHMCECLLADDWFKQASTGTTGLLGSDLYVSHLAEGQPDIFLWQWQRLREEKANNAGAFQASLYIRFAKILMAKASLMTRSRVRTRLHGKQWALRKGWGIGAIDAIYQPEVFIAVWFFIPQRKWHS